jgi:predicted nucleic acid-binding protein
LGSEPAKQGECEGVIRAAEKGEIQIVASALALAEVIKIKHSRPRLSKADEGKLRAFFKNPYIVVVGVDRALAEAARQLCWDHDGLDPKDAIHVATALRAKAVHLDTFDGKLIGFDGQVGGEPPLKIGRPSLAFQGVLSGWQEAVENVEDEEAEDEGDEP